LLIVVLQSSGARPDAERIAVSPRVHAWLSSLKETHLARDEGVHVLLVGRKVFERSCR